MFIDFFRPLDAQKNEYSGEFDDEPPLLVELGINFDHIYSKTLSVINPLKSLDESVLADCDLAGPLLFCWLQGVCLMFSGKLQFGYLFGFGLVGCFLLCTLLNLMQQQEALSIDGYRTVSIIGYCLLPMVFLSLLSIALNLSSGTVGLILTIIATLWSTTTATRFFTQSMKMDLQRYLIAYPVLMFYTSFALLTIF